MFDQFRPRDCFRIAIAPANAMHIASGPTTAYPRSSTVATSPGRSTSESLVGRRILLAEDEMMIALDIEIALEDAGAEVIGPVDDIDVGLRLLRGEIEIDAAVLDVDLHGKDVFPIAEALHARGVPFLFHTGHGSREELKNRFDGAPVCIKPVLAEDMLIEVANLLK